MYCYGFVNGVFSIATLNIDNVDKVKVKKNVCVTGNVTVGDAVKVFENWSDKHPEEWGRGAGVGVWNSINDTWHCPD
jgi:hypothetical protein